MLIKLALKNILNTKRVSILFVLNIALGFLGFILIDSYRVSFERASKAKAQETLTADIGFLSRSPIEESFKAKALAILGPEEASTNVLEFYSMVRAKADSRLVLVRAIEPGYPFYGALTFYQASDAKKFSQLNANTSWVSPDLKLQLALADGDDLVIGNQIFRVDGAFKADVNQSFRGFNLAPSLYVSLSQVKKLDFIQKGSTLTYVWLLKYPNGFTPKVDELNKLIKNEVKEEGDIRLLTPEKSSEQAARLIDYLSDFLGLASLVGILLSQLGFLYIAKYILVKRMKTFAILNVLGLRKLKILGVFIIEVLILFCLAFLLSVALSQLLFPIMSEVMSSLGGVKIEAQLFLGNLAIVFSLMCGISLAGLVPFLKDFFSLPTKNLFSEVFIFEKNQSNKSPFKRLWMPLVSFFPVVLIFIGLAIWQARSFRNGLVFVAALVVSLIILSLFFYLAKKLLVWLENKRIPYALRQGILLITRQGSQPKVAYMALSLALILNIFVPQLFLALERDLKINAQKMPQFFLFDIQDDQVEQLKTFIEEKGVALDALSPMVRARLLKVNDEEFKKSKKQEGGLRLFQTREEETSERFRNRGFNLSFREKLADEEKIVSGEPFPAKPGDMAKLSIEKRFAERLDLKIGDKLLFDIQGLEIEGLVYNLRTVNWASFRPNFFVLFEPGFIEMAPKTWLGTLVARGTLEEKNALQLALSKEFPNVSLVDVGLVVDRFIAISSLVVRALTFMGVICLLAGLFVFVLLEINQLEAKKREYFLFRILGATETKVRWIFVSEAVILCLLAALTAVLISVIPTGLALNFIFDSSFFFDWRVPALVFIGSLVFALLISILIVKSLDKKNVQELFSLYQKD